ncbi:MAG: Dabb family protein [Lachnospiraceae bacterium]|nr:Dabb family protein [Lachnospiraceae bacterium]
MVKHIVLWNFNAEMTAEEKRTAGAKMKELLEPIKDLVPGAVEIKVVMNEMVSSNREIALIGTYETEEALKAYQVHPAHVEAGKYVRSVTCDRACLDYEV